MIDSSSSPGTIEALTERLRARRVEAMSPSYSEIARRVAQLRTERGVPASDRTPGRVTVYDCFRTDRRRIDVPLVLDIVVALGADEAELARWRDWCRQLRSRREHGVVVTARPVLPPIALPHTRRRLASGIAAHGTTVLAGMPGAGKTQIATVALRSLVDAGILSGAITVDVRGSEPDTPPVHVRAILDGIARALGREVDDRRPTVQRVRNIARVLATERIGVLLDDVSSSSEVRRLVQEISSTPLVITSRAALDIGGAERLTVTGWAPDEAAGFLAEYLGPDPVAAEADAVATIIDLTGGLPLAMTLAATRIAQRPDWSLRDHADALRTRFEGLHLPGDVTSALQLSYQALSEEERRALRLLASLPVHRIPRLMTAALWDVTADAAEETLNALATAHLIDCDPDGGIAMHALVRTFATAQSVDDDPQAQRDAALDRLAGAYHAEAHRADAAWPAGLVSREAEKDPMDPAAATEWFRAEVGHIIELCHALAERRPDLTFELAEATSRYVESESWHRGAEPMFQLALECAHRLDDPNALTVAERLVGAGLLRRGEPRAVAHLTRALEIAREADLPHGAAAAANGLAIHALYTGDVSGALAWLREVRAGAHDAAMPIVANNIGVVLRYLGDLEGAAEHHLEAYHLYTANHEDSGAGGALSNLSEVYLVAGEIERATETARTAVRLTSGEGIGRHAHSLTNLGNALHAQGDLIGARETHERARALSGAVGDLTVVAYILTNLAVCLRDLGEHTAARAHLQRAYTFAVDADLRYELGRAQLELAVYDLDDGDHDAARTRLAAAIAALRNHRGPEVDRAKALWESLPAAR
ncbi:tetratricopeptide repeat protein [Microbacterium sp.]|uniref:tetratricopeptide repeat protein n=1 Tax=Microbacterium sp. TaxID=51671 RepID=UPI003A8AF197